MSDRRVALLVVHTNSYFSNLLPVAQLLARTPGWEPRFVFASWYPTLARDQARCREAGLAFETTAREPPAGRVARAVLARVRDRAAYAAAHLVRTMRALRAAIRRGNVALVILPADNRYDLAAYVKAAHAEGIRVLALPAFMAAADEWAQFVFEDPAYQLDRVTNRLAAAVFPRWVHAHAGRPLLALPAGEIVAREALGLAPPRPWTLHSGHADAIGVESEALRRYCLLEGIPARQLVLTGSIDHDRMFGRLADAPALREALYRELGLPPGRPLILTALAPDWLYGRGRPGCEFTDYRELVRCWIETLAASGKFNVVVSLHPSVDREALAYVEQWGAKIADASVATLIPLCEVYVACVSATIQWAIACGKPVINYDVYRFRYPDYLGVPGVLNLETRAAYAAAVERVHDDAARAELAAAQGGAARYWGLLDGKAGERLLALCSALCE